MKEKLTELYRTYLVVHDNIFAIKTIDRPILNSNGKISQYYLYTMNNFRRFNQLDLYSFAVPYSWQLSTLKWLSLFCDLTAFIRKEWIMLLVLKPRQNEKRVSSCARILSFLQRKRNASFYEKNFSMLFAQCFLLLQLLTLKLISIYFCLYPINI